MMTRKTPSELLIIIGLIGARMIRLGAILRRAVAGVLYTFPTQNREHRRRGEWESDLSRIVVSSADVCSDGREYKCNTDYLFESIEAETPTLTKVGCVISTWTARNYYITSPEAVLETCMSSPCSFDESTACLTSIYSSNRILDADLDGTGQHDIV